MSAFVCKWHLMATIITLSPHSDVAMLG